MKQLEPRVSQLKKLKNLVEQGIANWSDWKKLYIIDDLPAPKVEIHEPTEEEKKGRVLSGTVTAHIVGTIHEEDEETTND